MSLGDNEWITELLNTFDIKLILHHEVSNSVETVYETTDGTSTKITIHSIKNGEAITPKTITIFR